MRLTRRRRDYSIARNGHKHTYRVSCTILRNQQKDEIGTVVYVRDVTEKALLEERLRRMERYMGLGSLAAGLQHEIKNPLATDAAYPAPAGTIVSSATGSRCQGDTGYPAGRSQSYQQSPRWLPQLRHGQSSREVPCRHPKSCRETGSFTRPQTDNYNVVIDVHLPPEPLGTVLADEAQLEQVLLNLAD